MTQGSKLTQNMAVSILLGAISVSQSPLAKNTSNLSGSATAVTNTSNSNDSTPRTFVLNIKAIDGVKYECERPHHDHFSPFALSDKTDRKDRNIIRRFSTDNSVLSDKLNPYLSTRSIKKAPNSAPDTVFSGKEKGEIFSNISHDLGGTSIISKDFNMTSCTDDTSVRTGGCDSCGSTLEIPLFGHVGDGEVNNNTLCLSVCMFVCLLVCTSSTVFIPLCLSFYPSAFISAYCSSIFIHLFIDLSLYPSIYPSISSSININFLFVFIIILLNLFFPFFPFFVLIPLQYPQSPLPSTDSGYLSLPISTLLPTLHYILSPLSPLPLLSTSPTTPHHTSHTTHDIDRIRIVNKPLSLAAPSLLFLLLYLSL